METKRLILRERTPELLRTVLTQPQEAQMAFFGINDPQELANTLQKIEEYRVTGVGKKRQWDLIEKSSQKVIGSGGYFSWYEEHQRAEVGYGLHEPFRGNGYMFEALEAIVNHGFKDMKLNRIEAFISPDNEPSKRTVEKLGFVLEGRLREHYMSDGKLHDSLAFSLLKSDYE